MATRRDIPWLRILAEGSAIVVSILLAFWIDAWWQQRAETAKTNALLASLHADFEASQAQLETWLAGNRRNHRDSKELLQQLSSADPGAEIPVPMELIVSVIGAPTYSPTDATLETLFNSGQIELITDTELRNALALWQQQLEDTNEDELLLREIVVHRLVPELSGQVRLARPFDFDTLVGQFFDPSAPRQGETLKVRATSALEGVVAQRVFLSRFVVDGLADLHETQEEILQLLESHLDNL